MDELKDVKVDDDWKRDLPQKLLSQFREPHKRSRMYCHRLDITTSVMHRHQFSNTTLINWKDWQTSKLTKCGMLPPVRSTMYLTVTYQLTKRGFLRAHCQCVLIKGEYGQEVQYGKNLEESYAKKLDHFAPCGKH